MLDKNLGYCLHYPLGLSMSSTNAGLVKARRVFTEHGGMLRTGKAIRLGIHPRTIYALRDAGEIEQVGRGLYRLSAAPPLSHPDLVPIVLRVPAQSFA